MKKLLIITVSLFCASFCNAQYVTIPDSNFVNFLQYTFPNAMSGNQMDTTSPVITNAKKVVCMYSGVSNMYGIQFFDSLETFQCTDNILTTLPKLPNTLVYFYCYNNKLTELPDLPSNLKELSCYNNQLTSLPRLPKTLRSVICTNNQITNLPDLPSSMNFIDCANNKLDSLPKLPIGLQNLDCDANQIINLPSLPNSLNYLNCGYNKLTKIPKLPSNLLGLSCGFNNLNQLPPLPNNLRSIRCDSLQLRSLPRLPNSVSWLSCRYNILDSIVNLPEDLYVLDCSNNRLTKLPKLPAGLSKLICSSNNLSGIPTLPNSLYEFVCTDNPRLSCLPYYSQSRFATFEVKKNTNVRCLPRITQVYNEGDSSSYLPVCSLKSGCPVTLSLIGNVHQDTSASCIKDSIKNGRPLRGVKMQQYINGVLANQSYTDINGQYSFGALLGDTVVVKMDDPVSLKVSCPSSEYRKVIYTTTDTLFTKQDFGVTCKGADLGVWSINGTFRPTRSRIITIQAGDPSHHYNLNCSAGIGGTVTTTISGPVKYVKPHPIALTPSSVNGNTLTYTISDFNKVNPKTAFNIILSTDSTAKIGSEVCIKTRISTVKGDANPTNDSLQFCAKVVNSYDPNDKSAYPSKVAKPSEWITYTIRFQNTGTDTAYHIIVMDTLSDYLDESTFAFLDGSVQPIITLKGKAVMFSYPGINLLDSFKNESESHGWVQYKIKTVDNLKPFKEIKNTAFIYFDQNSPVVTNTTTNEYVKRTSQDITTCDSAYIHGKTYYTSQRIVDTLNRNGMYEIVSTKLVISKSSYSSRDLVGCDSVTHRGKTYYSSQTIRDTFSNSQGCDSFIIAHLKIHHSSYTQREITACDSILFKGLTYYFSQSIEDTFSNFQGCDSIVNTVLNINSVDTKTTLNNVTISSSQAGAQYQWLDCDKNYSIITSSSEQSYTATRNGNYAVEVTFQDCTDTSKCVNINTLSALDKNPNNSIVVYPNPTKGEIHIQMDEVQTRLHATVTSAEGQLIASKTEMNSDKLTYDLDTAANGIYFIQITTDDDVIAVVRVVVH